MWIKDIFNISRMTSPKKELPFLDEDEIDKSDYHLFISMDKMTIDFLPSLSLYNKEFEEFTIEFRFLIFGITFMIERY